MASGYSCNRLVTHLVLVIGSYKLFSIECRHVKSWLIWLQLNKSELTKICVNPIKLQAFIKCKPTCDRRGRTAPVWSSVEAENKSQQVQDISLLGSQRLSKLLSTHLFMLTQVVSNIPMRRSTPSSMSRITSGGLRKARISDRVWGLMLPTAFCAAVIRGWTWVKRKWDQNGKNFKAFLICTYHTYRATQ